jgi:CheY-like chemotaxis protein
VLVIDDNHDAADSLSTLLGLWGHETRVAYDGPSALAMVAAYRPEFVLLDIGLPELDGYEVARHLRAAGDLGPMTLIAVTGYGQIEDRERSLQAGFDHHLVKPIEPRPLRELLAAEPGLGGAAAEGDPAPQPVS